MNLIAFSIYVSFKFEFSEIHIKLLWLQSWFYYSYLWRDTFRNFQTLFLKWSQVPLSKKVRILNICSFIVNNASHIIHELNLVTHFYILIFKSRSHCYSISHLLIIPFLFLLWNYLPFLNKFLDLNFSDIVFIHLFIKCLNFKISITNNS